MSKRFVILLIVIIMISITFVLKFTVKTENAQIPTGPKIDNLEEEYMKINDSGKPSIIVFSYDIWCCDETHALFEEYNKKVLKILDDYKDKYETLFVNTKTLDTQSKYYLEDISIEYLMFQFPSILIRDSEGDLIYLEEEMDFDEDFLRNKLDGINND